MNLPKIFGGLESGLPSMLSPSRMKNQVVGSGHIAGLKIVSKLLNVPKPTTFTGQGSSIQLCESIADFGLNKLLVVTDRVLYELGVLNDMLATLDKLGMAYSLFTEVQPDPTFDVVEAGLLQYRSDNCDSVLAIGGGSSIDAAKAMALAATNNAKVEDLIGILKGKKPAAPFFVVPTTAGTGSEATFAAVISDPVKHQKGMVLDTKTVPMIAALDPLLMTGLPPHITAATGMDALTHLIEAYLSGMANDECDYYVRSGIKIIFENLEKACEQGDDLVAREKMALASYYGGLAINIGGLGYVHAFAHQLGANYHVPHGVANAKVLPHILEFNKVVSQGRLAELARVIGVDDAGANDLQLAEKFIQAVKSLSTNIGIEPTVSELQQAHFDDMIANAFKETNTTYAIPKYMSKAEAVSILTALSE